MPNKWDHLPNAAYIDKILYSVVHTPEKWRGIMMVNNWTADWNELWNSTPTPMLNILRSTSYHLTDPYVDSIAWGAASGALLCLMVRPECCYIMDSDIKDIKLLAELGDKNAGLMLTSCIVLNG